MKGVGDGMVGGFDEFKILVHNQGVPFDGI
jgi:hypothetical protein